MRNILLFIMLVVGFVANGDERSAAILKSLSSKLNSMGAYRVKFVVNAHPDVIDAPGEYVVSGDRYIITFGDRELISDGVTKYEIDHATKEITISKVDGNDKNILSNPTKAFDFLDGSFLHQVKAEKSVDGKSCKEISLSPVAQTEGVENISLFVDIATNQPVALSYSISGVRNPVVVSVKSLSADKEIKVGSIAFDKSKYKGYEMIDFR